MQWETKMGFLDEPNVFPWPYQPQPHVVHIQDCFLFWSFCTTAPNPLKTFFPWWQLPKLHFIFSWAESAFKLPHHQESRSRNSAKSQHLIDSPGFRILSPTSLALFFLVVKTDYLCIVLWCRFIYFYVKSFLILPVLFDSDVHSWLHGPIFLPHRRRPQIQAKVSSLEKYCPGKASGQGADQSIYFTLKWSQPHPSFTL